MMILITDADIIRLFMSGLSIKHLIENVSSSEHCTKSAARFKVEHALYGYMKKCNEF